MAAALFYVSAVHATTGGDRNAWVDPSGIVFNAATGVAVGGATVLLFSVDNNAPAIVFCDDGVTRCPSTLVTTAAPTLDPQLGLVPAGGFRFPLVAPGQYRLAVTPPAGFAAPSSAPGPFPRDINNQSFTIAPGSRGELFTVPVGPAINLDYPVDPAGFLLTSVVSQPLAGVGDFLQYRLNLQNLNPVGATNTIITDRLPEGFRYQAGSLNAAGARQPDPTISADGRTLTFPVGGLAMNQSVPITYVAQVSAGARTGQAVNSASAVADGPTISNVALVAVDVRDSLMQSHDTIIGEVACHAGVAAAPVAPSCPAAASAVPAAATTYTVRAQFESGKASLQDDGQKDLDALVASLEGKDIQRIELIGHTDSQRVGNPETLKTFRDNYGLSKARAATVGDYLAKALGLQDEQVSAVGRGPDKPVANNASPAGRARNRRTEVRVFERAPQATAAAAVCPPAPAAEVGAATAGRTGLQNVRVMLDDGTYVTSDQEGLFHFEGVNEGTHVVQVDLESLPPGYQIIPRIQNTRFAGRSFSQFVDVRGGGLWRTDFEACPVVAAPAAETPDVSQKQRRATIDDQTAAGASIDFVAGQAPGVDWLFPAADDVPRAPATRIAIKHLPRQTVVLKYVEGESVNPLSFDGIRTNADQTVAVSVWRGVSLRDGLNRFEALVMEDGAVVQKLERVIHYSSAPARAELVAAESALIADGIHKPVIAVRIYDANGQPVRAGVTGGFEINPPHVPAELFERQQQRQLSGLDNFNAMWRVEGDDGVAYIELAPTGDAGTAVLNFRFQPTLDTRRKQELRVWLESRPRDWVVVGFAEGTVGYNTLKGNVQPLSGAEDGAYTDGKVSLYAKGRVLGKWLLTMAYDSDKPEERRRRQSLLSTIDPQSFYTLYGDGAEQRYDAASQDKLYLKLERDQFYALFGDYETGLTQTQLSRYSRTLQGVKAEYGGTGPLHVTAFAADTPLNFARDEIQGNGTSGLYRLRTNNIVLNSERIRIETRDRFRSERIVDTRTLVRHLDYDIDYDAGTLFFHAPVYSRDSSFNPVFIVAEYESFNATGRELNAGGRVGTTLLDGKLSGGVSAIRDASPAREGRLGGVDFKAKLATDTELRVEAAASDGQGTAPNADRSGNAYLAEIEHHGAAFDILGYKRRQDSGFGLSQQNAAESGTDKTGVDGRVSLTGHVSLLGQAYRQDNLSSDATRDALSSQVEYRNDLGGVRLGGLYARDEAGPGALSGRRFESRQLTASGNRYLFDRKLELSAQGDTRIGGRNDSVDYPSRYSVGAAYAVTDEVRLIAAEEYTGGEAFDTFMTRVGLQASPWKGARLSSTLNQMNMGEYGPRSFGLFGLNQTLLIGQRWGIDFGADTSRAFNEDPVNRPALQVSANQPYASGGSLGSGTLTEDFVAVTGGVTYRDELWSWNGRIEFRNGETADRTGVTTHFLRQATAGIAFSLNAQGFSVDQVNGSQGRYGSAGMGWAWRPLGHRYSILDRLELRYDQLQDGSGLAGSSLFGNTSLVTTGDALSRRLINNFSLNRVSAEWTDEDRRGNLFDLTQRQQWSFYYGAKYAFDSFDGLNDHGYTDLTGLEWRWDLNRRVDVGLQASTLHAWSAHTYRYSYGPQVGLSPVTNGWVTLGWNFQGFVDRDFDAARYSAQGPYLTLRFKFDQNTRLFSHE